MPEYLDKISEFASALSFDDLPAAVVERAKVVLLDSLAVCAAGAQQQEVRALVDNIAPSSGAATLLGLGRKAEPLNAALINGFAGTFLELDEGNQFARGHPAIHVVPVLLAMGQEQKLSGRELIVSLVVGYEIAARIGIASKIRMSMHPHGTWGSVGAAVAVGRAAGVDAETMRQLINVSSSLGLATSRQTMLQGATVRNFYSGVSNQMGLLALKLVRAGVTGEADGLSTIYGSVISPSFDPAVMLEELGERFEISRNYFKLHACCRYNHSALDALLEIAARFENGRIPVSAVTKVEVETYSLAVQLCDPQPKNMLAAKFSIPFAIATTLIHGETGVNSFSADKVKDESILALAKRVTVLEDPKLTAMMPDRRPSRVTLTMSDATVHTAETFLNKGDFETPYSFAEITAKYYSLVEPVWGRETAEAFFADLMDLESVADINTITGRLV